MEHKIRKESNWLKSHFDHPAGVPTASFAQEFQEYSTLIWDKPLDSYYKHTGMEDLSELTENKWIGLTHLEWICRELNKLATNSFCFLIRGDRGNPQIIKSKLDQNPRIIESVVIPVHCGRDEHHNTFVSSFGKSGFHFA